MSFPDEQSLPVFLAANLVDVWGIDLRWPRVPLEVADPDAVVQDWNFQTDIDDLELELKFMRQMRAFTGSGKGKVALLGLAH